MKIGKPIKYISVQPEEIIDRVRKRIDEDTQISLRMFDEIKETDIFKDLELLHKTGIEKVDSQDLSTSIIGRENLNYFIKGLLDKAEQSIIITTTEDGFPRKINALNKLLKKKGKNNVKVKIIGPHEQKLAKKIKGNVEVINKETNSRIIMVDNREVLFMINDGKNDKHNDCGVWVDSEFFAQGLNQILKGILT